MICHADIHRANIIIDKRDDIRIVDWDETVLAPKERDLMFFLGDGHGRQVESAFLEGYGECTVDRIGLAYYRYDLGLTGICRLRRAPLPFLRP